ncbi:hypothetical protein GCM10027413_09060 [Conyzicola nivalis]|uniref:Uncharacterized protein n=1 Tax=Conyzicola nivalis TaxID=1477021 RepID=A0A916WIJ8_9MICO|nr:DUF5719 family protein [Conyzicola nivalis]GGB03396.1 hypothetical protein GCM10010979_17570 [Conyzicola nivalis]
MSDHNDPVAHHIEPVGDDYPVDENEAATPKAKITARGAAIVGVRMVAGTVGIAVALAAIAGATFLPITTVATTPASVDVTPVATAQELVCPGALLRLGDESGQSATTASSIGDPSVRFGSTSGGDDVSVNPLQQSDAGTAGTESAPVQIRSTTGGDDDLVSGAQGQTPGDGEFEGLATADCAGVASETWLVGGSTAVGRTTLITLANPSDTVSTVALAISTEDGKVTAPGVTGIVVQPHGQRVLPLAGFAPDVESPVVHVTSRGGQIVANLQQTTVRGIEPGGVDFVGAGHTPSTAQIISGVRVTGTDALQSRLGEEGYGDLASVLRVFAPGGEDTLAEVSVTSDDGAAAGASFSVDLAAGVVDDLALDGLVDGTYTVHITSSHPVVAGLRVSTVAGSAPEGEAPGSDFAWLSTVNALNDRALVTIADGPGPRVNLVNPTDADADVTLEATDGDDLTVTVPAEGAASVEVAAGDTYLVAGFDRLYGSVSYASDALVSGYPIQPPAASAEAITIFP